MGQPRLLSSGCCLEQLCSEPHLGVCGGGLSLVPPLVGGAVGFTPRSCPGSRLSWRGEFESGAGGGGGLEERMGMRAVEL